MKLRRLGVEEISPMSLSSWNLGRVVLGALVLVAGCGGRPATPPSTPQPAPVAEPVVVEDLLPNTRRDRRAEPGVRAAPKPLVLGKPRAVRCGKLSSPPKDTEPLDLLGGRLRVRPPPGGAIPPPQPDAPPIEEESRIVTEGGDISLAIVARETFQLDPDLYEPEPDAPAKPASLDVEAPKFLRATLPSESRLEVVPVEIGEGDTKLRAYAARPSRPGAPPGGDTALVLALLIAHDDGVLESVAFYVRGEPVRTAVGSRLVGCTRLAERIAATIVPGPRQLERAPGTRRVAALPSGEVLEVTVPADYVAIGMKDGGRLVKLRPLSLYAGSIAMTVVDEAPTAEGTDTTETGKLLGRPVEWRGSRTATGGFFVGAAPLEEGSRRNVVVLVRATRQAKALDEMRSVAETLAIRKP